MDSYRDQGFQYISVSSSNNQGQPPSQDNLMSWAESHGFVDIPALGMTQADSSYPSGLSWQWEGDGYIPTYYILGPDMTVLSADQMQDDPGSYIGG
jgi:hypothetical protein